MRCLCISLRFCEYDRIADIKGILRNTYKSSIKPEYQK